MKNICSTGENYFMKQKNRHAKMDFQNPPKALRQSAENAFSFAQEQVRKLITNYPDYFPLYTKEGRWFHQGEAWTRWCDGFLGGMLWIFAKRTGDPWWREKAEHYAWLIEPRKNERTTQSLWSLFWPTWKRWYDLTGDVKINAVPIQAGKTLAHRFNPKGRFLSAFVSPKSNLIDNMMSVGIIFYAASELCDTELMDIAVQHALTTRRYSIRGDGSTAQEAVFDLETGAFLRHGAHQGYRPDSSWARGQAWAIYGFRAAYQYSGDERFLDTAQRCADFYISRTPEHGIPPNDWEEPAPQFEFESSAAAAAASGLFQLAAICPDLDRAEHYRDYGMKIMASLCSTEFLAIDTPSWEGILKHGIYHQEKGLGVDESVMWGEYFFVEALDLLFDLDV